MENANSAKNYGNACDDNPSCADAQTLEAVLILDVSESPSHLPLQGAAGDHHAPERPVEELRASVFVDAPALVVVGDVERVGIEQPLPVGAHDAGLAVQGGSLRAL